MASISTTSVYTSQINETYPTAGQNNTSQGLRDNFKNIKNALLYADADISNLKLNSINLNNATNNFNYNVIESAVLQSVVNRGVDNSTGTPYDGDITVDFSQGSYQKFNLNGGIHTITVSNWPTTTDTSGGFRASVILYFSTESLNDTFVSFPSNYINLGPGILPKQIGPSIDNGGPWLFEASYDGSFYSVKQITEYSASTATSTSTSVINIGKNVYTTGTNAETIVAFNNQFGSLALLPTTISDSVLAYSSTPSALSFTITNVTNISIGATFFLNSGTQFSVTSVNSTTNSVITVPEASQYCSLGFHVTFVNPTFTAQPTVLQLSNIAPANGTTSAVNELKGTVYTDGSSVWLTYADYVVNANNKVLISGDTTGNPRSLGNASTATTQYHTDNSNLVATTEFVNNVVFNSTTTVNSSTYSLIASTSTNAEVVTGLTSNGYGTRTVGYGGPSGGADGDIWFQII